jgi:hypothetical protein
MFDSTILIFFLALLAIIGMLVLKAVEMRTGKQSVVAKMSAGVDPHVQAVHDTTKDVIRKFNRHTLVASIQWLAVHILSWLRGVYIKLYHLAHRYPHSKKVIDMVRGKGEVNRNNGSSFFLKQIDQEVTKDPVSNSIADSVPAAVASESVAQNPK